MAISNQTGIGNEWDRFQLAPNANESEATSTSSLRNTGNEWDQFKKAEDSDGSLFSRIGEDIERRKLEVSDTFTALNEGKIGAFQGIIQVGGKGVFGPIADSFGEVFTSVLEAVPDSAKEYASEVMSKIGETELGQEALSAINTGMEAWDVFKGNNPEYAKTLESAGLILMFATPAGKAKPARPALNKLGAKAVHEARKAKFNRKSDVANRLVRPVKTKAVAEDEVWRSTEKGRLLFKRTAIEAAEKEKDAAKAILKIKGISNNKTELGNFNLIRGQVDKIDNALQKRLSNIEIAYMPYEMKNRVRNDMARMAADNPIIASDATLMNTVNMVANKTNSLIDIHGASPLGLLKARRELDKWILKSRGGKFFEPSKDTALVVAVRSARDTLNNGIEGLAAGSKNSLRQMSSLLYGLDNMVPKVATEGKNVISRAFNRAAATLPIRSKLVQEAALVMGTAAIVAVEAAAPWVAGAAGAYVGARAGYRALTGPTLKRMAGAALKVVDKAIESGSRKRYVVEFVKGKGGVRSAGSGGYLVKKEVAPDLSLLRELRADRAALLEILKSEEDL